MNLATARKIKANPKYQELISTRGSFAWRLAIIMLVIYYTFIMIEAFEAQDVRCQTGISADGAVSH